MISIIISSVDSFNLKQVSENIDATIGVPFEIIATDNSNGQKGICEVYNQAMINAQYDILCFMHEDVLIKSNNWGQKLLSLFEQDPKLGLVGIAGSSYKPLAPSSWGGDGINTHYINLIQSFRNKKAKSKRVYSNPDKQSLAEVVCIDGVFMATPRKVAEEFMFDEITLKGFHGYDIDFSLSVSQNYKVAVTFDILLDHFSEGRFDDVWMAENIKLHNKWNEYLPKDVGGLTPEQMVFVERRTFKIFVDELIKFNYPISTAFKMLWKNKRFFSLDSALFFKLKFHIIKKYLKAGPSFASYIW
jgi:hypothetical protein